MFAPCFWGNILRSVRRAGLRPEDGEFAHLCWLVASCLTDNTMGF